MFKGLSLVLWFLPLIAIVFIGTEIWTGPYPVALAIAGVIGTAFGYDVLKLLCILPRTAFHWPTIFVTFVLSLCFAIVALWYLWLGAENTLSRPLAIVVFVGLAAAAAYGAALSETKLKESLIAARLRTSPDET